jgi:hypothetical protein
VAEDLQTASRIGTRLTRIVGLREQAPAQAAAATDQRQRVFTLTLRAYEEARSAVTYLRRREGDAESIAPNLYTGKARRRPTDSSTTDGSTTGTPDAPAAGTGTSAGAPSGNASTPAAGSGTPTPAVSPTAAAAAVAAQKGGPGSKDPFLS